MFISSQKLYIEILSAMVMVLGGGVLGRWLSHQGRVRMNDFSVVIKEAQESTLTASTTGGHRERASSMN